MVGIEQAQQSNSTTAGHLIPSHPIDSLFIYKKITWRYTSFHIPSLSDHSATYEPPLTLSRS